MANLTASNLTNVIKEMDSITHSDATRHCFRVFLIVNIIMNSIACPFTIGLNVLVILGIRRRRSLQSNANIMLACLATTDVLTGLDVQPALIIWNISQLVGDEERFTGFLILQWFLFPWFSLSSCLHLMAVVCERLVAIKFPYRYPSVVTKRNMKLAILFCWIYSGSCRTSMFLLGTKTGSLYGILASHIPIVCVIFVSSSYVVLYSETRRHQKLIKDQCLSQEDVKRFLKDRKALKTTVFVFTALGICLLPVILYIVMVNYDDRVYLVRGGFFTSVTLNSLLNPLIYCCRQRELRKFILRPFPQAVNPIN